MAPKTTSDDTTREETTSADTTSADEAKRHKRERIRNAIYSFFFGSSEVLRAGWRLLLYLFLLAILTTLLFFSVWPLLHLQTHGDSPWLPLAGDGLQLAGTILAAFLLSRIERRPAISGGFRGPARVLRFASGLFWGLTLLSLLVFAMAGLHLLTIGPAELSRGAALRFALIHAVGFLCVAFFEESLFRGYLQSILTCGMGFPASAVVLSLAFGGVHLHNLGESPLGIVTAILVALLFCISLWYTGSLWWAFGFHAAWDWGQSYLYGTPDSGLLLQGHLHTTLPHGAPLLSGGNTGPEGSLYAVILLLIVTPVAYLWWRSRLTPEWPAAHHELPAGERA